MSEEYPMHTCESGALKHLEDKLRLDLIPPECIEAIGSVLSYGAKKYSDRNWEKGIQMSIQYGSALRHLMSWAKGIDIDKESGLHHIDQALTNLAMIATQTRRGRVDLDDRQNLDN